MPFHAYCIGVHSVTVVGQKLVGKRDINLQQDSTEMPFFKAIPHPERQDLILPLIALFCFCSSNFESVKQSKSTI